MTRRRHTKAEKTHLDAVASLGCIACRKLGVMNSPAECHHPRTGVGAGRRSSHFDAIPLCPRHHRLGNRGVAIHAGKETWEAKFGTELELLAEVTELLGKVVAR